MSIVIKTRLHRHIYKSHGGGETRTHYTFATGPRNLLKAIETLGEHCKDMKEGYGNIGCGCSWLEIDGQVIHSLDLDAVARDDFKFFPRKALPCYEHKSRTTKAKELIAAVAAGYDATKYDFVATVEELYSADGDAP